MSALLRLSLLALVTSSLPACSDSKQLWRESEIRDIAEDEAASVGYAVDTNADITNDQSAKIEELESEIDSLQFEIDSLRSRIETHQHF